MTTLNFNGVPAELHMASHKLEFASTQANDILEVPAMLGWRVHAGIRKPEHPTRTHVCSSAYDHVNLDISRTRVADLYQNHPQLETFVSLADQPGALSRRDAVERLVRWGVPADQVLEQSASLHADDVYAASPIFLLHREDGGRDPMAMVACDYRLSVAHGNRIAADVVIQAVATSPDLERRGLAHLLLLEASRWLGMLTRSITIHDGNSHHFLQRIHACPSDGFGYQLARAFYSNYAFFGVTDELVENTKYELDEGISVSGTVRSGLGTIVGFTGVEDMIQIPDGISRPLMVEESFEDIVIA